MSNTNDTHDGKCPGCGHEFSLAELKRMAVGDGWQRYLRVKMPDGSIEVVSFDNFIPHCMTPVGEAPSVDAIKEPEAEEV